MPVEATLVLLHPEPDGTLGKHALETVGAVTSLSDTELTIGLAGGDVQRSADQIAACGARRFLAVAGDGFVQPRYGTDAAAAEALARAAQATLVLAPATSRWNRVLAGVSHRLGGRVDSHVTGLGMGSGGLEATRWFYRQRMEASFRRASRPWFLALDPGCFPAWSGVAGSASVEEVQVPVPEAALRTRVTGVRSPSAEVQTIRPEADLLFVAGAGWTKRQADGQAHVAEAEALILEFLRRSGASLGSSKSLVDISGEGEAVLSFLTHMNQIGQTGATPRHPKGLSTCCHGEEPHAVGWRFVHERRAISLDPNCGWARGKADVLYVADAFAVLRRVNELLAAGPGGS